MSLRAFAIKRNGVIDVATISDSETEAKKKWLLATFKGAWLSGETDALFDRLAPHSTEYPSCVRVNITEQP